MHVISLTYATATWPIHPRSLHDALPISVAISSLDHRFSAPGKSFGPHHRRTIEDATSRPSRTMLTNFASGSMRARAFIRCALDRKSTRLNSSHVAISYAVLGLKDDEPSS